MYAREYIYVYVHVYVCMCVCMYVYMYVYISICMYMCMCTLIFIFLNKILFNFFYVRFLDILLFLFKLYIMNFNLSHLYEFSFFAKLSFVFYCPISFSLTDER